MSEPDVKFRAGVLERRSYGPEKRRDRSTLAAIAIFTYLDYNGPSLRRANCTADHAFPIFNRTCVAVKMAGDVGSEATAGSEMLVPFGTKVIDTDGKAIGSLKHLVLDPQSRQVVGFVVHHGLLHRLEVVVPLSKVAAFGEEVRLALHADEIDDLQLFHAPHFQVMPDHWEMPLGFDQRDFFLVGGLGWAGAMYRSRRLHPPSRERRASSSTRRLPRTRRSWMSLPACTSTMAPGSGWEMSSLWNSIRSQGRSAASPSRAAFCSTQR